MELAAACVALETIDEGLTVTVYSDSSYLVTCMRRAWHKKWPENGWLNHRKEPVANRDLWERLLEATQRHQEVRWRKVEGHQKTQSSHKSGNDRADELAVAAKKEARDRRQHRRHRDEMAPARDTEIEICALPIVYAYRREAEKEDRSMHQSDENQGVRPPLPPFDEESARQKVKMAQDAWNTRDPERVALAYTEDSKWRNRDEFFEGRDAIRDFLRRKWSRELDYRLEKNLWCFTDNRIAVRFEYESHDKDGQWWRSHGNELWEFDENGLMRRRDASINDYKIDQSERKFRWTR